MDAFKRYGIDSGEGLLSFVIDSGLAVQNATGIEGSQNVIYLPDLTTFNWKSTDRIVRINCKEPAKNIIESVSKLNHIENGSGDPTRPYSFTISSFSDLIDVIFALKTIETNI